ncbi:MAG: LysR family transcriptional regulator [Clostridiales bacterium]|nr:LysR family transcriptional regulator [Clostridiales bacterium]
MEQLTYTLTLRVYGKEKVIGPGMAELLEKIDALKSIRKATADMGMAYSKAWRILKNAEDSLGFALLSLTTGGKGGGGAQLTQEGRDFLDAYRRFEREVGEQAERIFERIFEQ